MPPQYSSISSRALTPAGAGAAPQVDASVPGESGFGHLGELVGEHQPHLGILVADVNEGVRRLDHPGRDQHSLDEAMRIALEIVPILEGAGLALVGIDR